MSAMDEAWEFHEQPPEDLYPDMDAVMCSGCGTPSESGYLDRQRRVWVCEECLEEGLEEEAAE